MGLLRKLIRASAGTGKTFQLSGHFLKQLFAGHRPETILATTFTRKAAGEILGRVLLRLADAADSAKGAKILAEQLENSEVTQQSAEQLLVELTRELHRVRVCTLDSFFQMVARSLSLELGLSPGWKIIDEHVDEDLRQQAIDAVLAQEVPKDAQQLMQMLAKGRSKRSIRDLINDTVANYHEIFMATDESAWTRFPAFSKMADSELAAAMENVKAVAQSTAEKLVTVCEEDVKKFEAGFYDGFISRGLPPKILDGSLNYSRKPIPPELAFAYQPLIDHAKAEIVGQIARQTTAIRDLMTRFDREYNRLKSEQGWLKFSDVTRLLARAEEAAQGHRMNFRLDSSIHHLLLDEFQDTSPDQWRILRRLTESIVSQKEKASFFCVGDGKQAIYGWRGGVSEILDVVASSIPEISVTQMDQSRRSSASVIETVNGVFEHVIRHSDLGDYEQACKEWVERYPVHSTFRDIPGYVCLKTSPAFEGSTKDERSGPWHRWVASEIARIHQEAPGAEIGVLTRRNGTVARLVHELALLGVTASEEGGTSPVDSPAVLGILSLFHFMSHPGCEVSRFHVANSPLGPVIGLFTWNDSQQALAIASILRSQLIDHGYGAMLQKWSEAVARDCHVRDRLRLQQIVAAGYQFDEAGALDPCEFNRLLEGSRFSKAEPASVRVMTIHQSKGLEFDIVVLPELDEKLLQTPNAAVGFAERGGSADRVVVWRSREARALLPQPLREAFDETIHRQVSETLCTLYVAMTRAVHAMHMLIQPSKKPGKTFSGLIRAAICDSLPADPETTLYENGNPEWYASLPDLLTAAHHPAPRAQSEVFRVQLAPMTDGRRRGLIRRAPSRHDEAYLYLPSLTSSAGQERPEVDAKTRGTVMHSWFQEILWLEPGMRPDPLPLRQKAIEELAMSETTINTLIPDFYAFLELPAVSSVVEKSEVERLPVFQSASKRIGRPLTLEAHPERSFVRIEDSKIVSGTIDRLVLALDRGQPVAADIVDYKTDRLVGDRQEWIEQKTEHYRDQLQEYRSAVTHCFGLHPESISARLVLLEAGTVIHV